MLNWSDVIQIMFYSMLTAGYDVELGNVALSLFSNDTIGVELCPINVSDLACIFRHNNGRL